MTVRLITKERRQELARRSMVRWDKVYEKKALKLDKKFNEFLESKGTVLPNQMVHSLSLIAVKNK